jgi:hypothetical protein
MKFWFDWSIFCESGGALLEKRFERCALEDVWNLGFLVSFVSE